MKRRLGRFPAVAVLCSLVGIGQSVGCGQELPTWATTDTSTSSQTTDATSSAILDETWSSSNETLTSLSDSATSSFVSSTSTPTASADSDDPSATASTDTSDSHSVSDASTSSTGDTTPLKKADGDFCTDDEQCASNVCGLMSRCGACRDDAQCVAVGLKNCTMNPREVPICSKGRLGERCQSDQACLSGTCALRAGDGSEGICSACKDAAQCREQGLGSNCQRGKAQRWWQCTSGQAGESCMSALDCASQRCHLDEAAATGRGLCSSCVDDAQCQNEGTGLNCVLSRGQPEGSLSFVCKNGALGQPCEGASSCAAPLVCANLSPTGAGERQTCSMCAADPHCEDPTRVCSLQRGPLVAGQPPLDRLACVAAKSQADGTWCTPKVDSSVDACVGQCAAVPVDDTRALGVCGTCRPERVPSDCPAGKRCVAPTIDPVHGPQAAYCD